jgi:hypothetical protein
MELDSAPCDDGILELNVVYARPSQHPAPIHLPIRGEGNRSEAFDRCELAVFPVCSTAGGRVVVNPEFEDVRYSAYCASPLPNDRCASNLPVGSGSALLSAARQCWWLGRSVS